MFSVKQNQLIWTWINSWNLSTRWNVWIAICSKRSRYPYNKDMFEQHGWETPETWNEFTALCEQIQSEGVQPLYFGFKDTWTCLAPWNALAVSLADPQLCSQVNNGTTTFTKAYDETAEKMKALLAYGEPNPTAYSYNDACTAFARGQSAMYTIGSYAISQIKSVNPDMNIGTFTFPANDEEADNVLKFRH